MSNAPDFGPEAKALAESWMAQHERKLMIVAIGAREAMIESLAAAIQAFGAAAYRRAMMDAAKIARDTFPPGSAHTYASENADIYRGCEIGCLRAAEAIESRIAARKGTT